MEDYSISRLPQLLDGQLSAEQHSAILQTAESQPAFARAFFELLGQPNDFEKRHPDLVGRMRKRFIGTGTAPSAAIDHIAQRQLNGMKQADSLSHLMGLHEKAWASRRTENLDAVLDRFADLFTPDGRENDSLGFIEKFRVHEGERVAVIGDLHGNPMRLDRTLRALQKRGILDERFRCVQGCRIVLLGDYVDRGENSLRTLEMLATLKLENPLQVHMVRGNHEKVREPGSDDAEADTDYETYLGEKKNRELLTRFFDSLPVTLYLGVEDGVGRTRYTQFSHGLFHAHTDPAQALDSRLPYAAQWVNGASTFSDRVITILDGTQGSNKQQRAAHDISYLANNVFQTRFKDIMWLDAGLTFKASAHGRTQLPPDIIKAYLRLSSTERSAVKWLIRGHQSDVWSILHGKRQEPLVTTLDPSKEAEMQLFMELTTAPRVRDWQKQAVLLGLDGSIEESLDSMEVGDADEFIEPLNLPPPGSAQA